MSSPSVPTISYNNRLNVYSTPKVLASSSTVENPLTLPDNFFNREKAEALFFKKHPIQNTSFSFAEFFFRIRGTPLLTGSFANHLVLNFISYKDIDFKIDIADLDEAILQAAAFFQEKNIEGVFTKFESFSKNPLEINANLELTFLIDQKEIKVDFILTQKKKRETLFDGFGFLLENFNAEEGTITPCVLKGKQRSFAIEDLLKLKENLFNLNLNITDSFSCNQASFRRSVEAFCKGYFLSFENQREIVEMVFRTLLFQGKKYDAIEFSMKLQPHEIEPFDEKNLRFHVEIEERVAFLMNTVFFFIQNAKREEQGRYKEVKEANIFRESGFTCFHEMYKRLKLSNTIMAKHPIFKYLHRLNSDPEKQDKVLERWTHLLNEIALQYFIRGIALKGVKITFKEEEEQLFVSMAFSENATLWFKLDKRTKEEDLSIKSYLAHHLPEDLFEEVTPLYPEARRLEVENSKVYEEILLKAKKPQVFLWYVERTLENTVSDAFILFLIQKGIFFFKGEERESFFERVINKLEKHGKGSADREVILDFFRSKTKNKETSFLELRKEVQPFLFEALEENSPHFWLSFLETEDEIIFKNHLELIWPHLSQTDQKEVACTFFLKWKGAISVFFTPFLADLDNHFISLDEEEKKILQPLRPQEKKQPVQQQNLSKAYSGSKGDERFNQFIGMTLSAKVSNFKQLLTFLKQERKKTESMLLHSKMEELWSLYPHLAAQLILEVYTIALFKESEHKLEKIFKLNPKVLYHLFQNTAWALTIAESPHLMNQPFLSEFKEAALLILLSNEKYDEASAALRKGGNKINAKAVAKKLAEKWDKLDLNNPLCFKTVSSLLQLMKDQEPEERENGIKSVIRKIEIKKFSQVATQEDALSFLEEMESLLKQPFVSSELRKEILQKAYESVVKQFFQKVNPSFVLKCLFDSQRGQYLSSESLEIAFKNGSLKIKQIIGKNYGERISPIVFQKTIENILNSSQIEGGLSLFVSYIDLKRGSGSFLTASQWKKAIELESNETIRLQGLRLYQQVGLNLEAYVEFLKSNCSFEEPKNSQELLFFLINIPDFEKCTLGFEIVEILLKKVPSKLESEEEKKVNDFLTLSLPFYYKSKKQKPLIESFVITEIIQKGQVRETMEEQENKISFYAPPFLDFFKERWGNIENEALSFLLFYFQYNHYIIETPVKIWMECFNKANKGTVSEKNTFIFSLLRVINVNIENPFSKEKKQIKKYVETVLPLIKKWTSYRKDILADLLFSCPEEALPHLRGFFDPENFNKIFGKNDNGYFVIAQLLSYIQDKPSLKSEYEELLCTPFFNEENPFFQPQLPFLKLKIPLRSLEVYSKLYTETHGSVRVKKGMEECGVKGGKTRLQVVKRAISCLIDLCLEEIKGDPERLGGFLKHYWICVFLFAPKKMKELDPEGAYFDFTVFEKLSFHCLMEVCKAFIHQEEGFVEWIENLQQKNKIPEFLENLFSFANVSRLIANGQSIDFINSGIISPILDVLAQKIPAQACPPSFTNWLRVVQSREVLNPRENIFEGLNEVQALLMVQKSGSIASRVYYSVEQFKSLRILVISEVNKWKSLPALQSLDAAPVFWMAVTKPYFESCEKTLGLFIQWHMVYKMFVQNTEDFSIFKDDQIEEAGDWFSFGCSFLPSFFTSRERNSEETDCYEKYNVPMAKTAFKNFLIEIGEFYTNLINRIIFSNLKEEGFSKILSSFHDNIVLNTVYLSRKSVDLLADFLVHWYKLLDSAAEILRGGHPELFVPLITLEVPIIEKSSYLTITTSAGVQDKVILDIIKYDIKKSFIRNGLYYPEELLYKKIKAFI